MLWMLLACLSPDGDSAPPETQDTERIKETAEPQGCEVLEVGHEGPDPGHVGDTWTVWPVCDGQAIFGAVVIRIDPTDMATQDNNELTWIRAGEVEIMAQAGSQRAYLTVQILE